MKRARKKEIKLFNNWKPPGDQDDYWNQHINLRKLKFSDPPNTPKKINEKYLEKSENCVEKDSYSIQCNIGSRQFVDKFSDFATKYFNLTPDKLSHGIPTFPTLDGFLSENFYNIIDQGYQKYEKTKIKQKDPDYIFYFYYGQLKILKKYLTAEKNKNEDIRKKG